MSRRLAGGIAATLVLAAGVGLSLRDELPPERAPSARMENLSGSIAFLEKRFEADPENYLAASHLVDRYLLRFQLGADLADVGRAEHIARAMLDVTPERAGALARLSNVHLTQHEFSEAMETAEAAVSIDGASEAALAALFSAAMAMGRYEQAEAALRRMDPQRVAGRIRIAQWLSATGESDAAHHHLQQACESLERAAAAAQAVAWCLTELAGLQFEREGDDAARALYRRALEHQPGYRGAIEGLADLAHAREDWKEADRLYSVVAADAHPDIYLRLAEVSRAWGDGSRAAHYDSLFLRVATAPGAEALYAQPLAMFYARSPHPLDAALAVARRDVARRPAAESYDVLAWVYLRRGELREALAASDRARRWGAPGPSSDLQRALILEALGRTAEAMPLRDQALRRPELLEPHLRSR